MKIIIATTVSADGHILPHCEDMQQSGKFALSVIRQKADMELHPNSSLLTLLACKQNDEDSTYFAELTPESINLIIGLQRYRLIDELYLYQSTTQSNGGILLADVVNLEGWQVENKYAISKSLHLKIYRKG